jgi:hypothetical protein
VWVDSPMLMLNDKMGIQRVTFTQDRNSGSQTTLDLVSPTMLNDGEIEGLDFPGEPTIATPEQLSQIPRIP